MKLKAFMWPTNENKMCCHFSLWFFFLLFWLKVCPKIVILITNILLQINSFKIIFWSKSIIPYWNERKHPSVPHPRRAPPGMLTVATRGQCHTDAHTRVSRNFNILKTILTEDKEYTPVGVMSVYTGGCTVCVQISVYKTGCNAMNLFDRLWRFAVCI